ncbi:MAG TPA: hypothetical protein VFS19_01070 [Planctomycetota bacterium]|nr:hypothetical protein [Planctomycetota bacterium]
MLARLLIAIAAAAALQDPPGKDEPFDIAITDPETGEYLALLNGVGRFDHVAGTGTARRMHATIFTKPSSSDPSHRIHLFSATSRLEGVGKEGGGGKATVRFSGGLRVLIDDEVRMWTSEGVLDVQKQTLKCPKTTHLVRYKWPQKLDLASALTFMDPQEEWLRLFGAPEPLFEFVGNEFEFDAGAHTFTAARKGRIRVVGDPGDALSLGKESKRPAAKDPTELRCDGPLRLRNLGSNDPEAWSSLHVTAEQNVVIEHRTQAALTRTRSDSASIYLGVPPKKQKAKARAQAVVLKGTVSFDEGSGFTATGDHLEWSHQDGIVRLLGAPRVAVNQGTQRLEAREVIIDQWNRIVDFKGDISVTFLPARAGTAPGTAEGLITMKPRELSLATDAEGRPIAMFARKGVRITSPPGTPPAEVYEAEGRDFEWDFVTGEGALRGAPFARIRQGPNVVVAPLITFSGEEFTESLMVIKGPKAMKFTIENEPPLHVGAAAMDAALGLGGFRPTPRQPTLHASATLLEASLGLPGLQHIPGREDALTDFVITCDGDAVVDQKANVVKLVDRCSVRAQDSTLTADRLFVYLSPGKPKTFDRVLGLGNVRAYQRQGSKGASFQFEGETLEMRQDPIQRARIVTVVGFPRGKGRLGSEEFEFLKLECNLNEMTFKIWKSSIPWRF